MAKLTNVKTVDMVNGEITKVAYDGAEYAKVDSVVESTEDILLAIEHGNDRTKGEFYRVIGVGIIIRWEDDVSTNGVSAEYIGERFAVFRKISAEPSPTLDERVTEKYSAIKEGDEVTINFAVWKKHGVLDDLTEGKRYKVIERRDGLNIIDDAGDERNLFVDEPEVVNVVKSLKYIPQVGDIVVVTGNTSGHSNSIGDIGKVGAEKPLGDGGVKVYVPGNSTVAIRTMPQDIRKATPAEVEAYEKAAHKASFAVGDYVKIVKSYCDNEGAILRITGIGNYRTGRGPCEFKLEALTGKTVGEESGATVEQIVKATDAEIAKATAPKLKAGDFVKWTDGSRSLPNGETFEVFKDCDGDLYVVDNDGDKRWSVLDSAAYKYEIVDAETAKWAKIGRKVGELRRGDIVRIKNHCGARGFSDGQITEVTGNSSTDSARVGSGWLVSAELIAPVESTVA